MDPDLLKLEGHLKSRDGGQPLADDDLRGLLAWAMHLTDAGYGWVGTEGFEAQAPEASLVTPPEIPWHGKKVSLKNCLAFAAQTAGRPVVFEKFPPALGTGGGTAVPLGGTFLNRGGRMRAEFPAPGGFLVAPIPGCGHLAGLLLDGRGTRFGKEACQSVSDLLAMAAVHLGPFPTPPEVLGEKGATAGDFPVVDLNGKRIPVDGPLTLGQDEQYEISIADELTSRRHAMIVPLADRGVMVIDLRSSNGTFVNGEAVEAKRLEVGDVVHTKQKKWSLVFRRVRPPRPVSALPPGTNRIGFDVCEDDGASLRRLVGSWTRPGEASRFGDYASIVACQLGLGRLALLWDSPGGLRFSGVDLAGGPSALEELTPDVLAWRKAALDGQEARGADGGASRLPGGPLGEDSVVAWKHREGTPGPDADALARIMATALGSGPVPLLSLPGNKEMDEYRERASRASSGKQCADLVQEVYRAGFPAEAVALGESMASRFLDADELEAVLDTIRPLLA